MRILPFGLSACCSRLRIPVHERSLWMFGYSAVLDSSIHRAYPYEYLNTIERILCAKLIVTGLESRGTSALETPRLMQRAAGCIRPALTSSNFLLHDSKFPCRAVSSSHAHHSDSQLSTSFPYRPILDIVRPARSQSLPTSKVFVNLNFVISCPQTTACTAVSYSLRAAIAQLSFHLPRSRQIRTLRMFVSSLFGDLGQRSARPRHHPGMQDRSTAPLEPVLHLVGRVNLRLCSMYIAHLRPPIIHKGLSQPASLNSANQAEVYIVTQVQLSSPGLERSTLL